jgi:hypothetical protein
MPERRLGSSTFGNQACIAASLMSSSPTARRFAPCPPRFKILKLSILSMN